MDTGAGTVTDVPFQVWHRPRLADVGVVGTGLLAFTLVIFLLREAGRGIAVFDNGLSTPDRFASDAILSGAIAVGSALAVAASFWVIYPIVGYLRIAELVPRVLVAAAIATVVVWIVAFLVQWGLNGPNAYQGDEWNYLLRSGIDGVPEVVGRMPLVFVVALALRELDWRRHDGKA